VKEAKVTPEMLDQLRPPAADDQGKLVQKPLAELFEGHIVVKIGSYSERQNLKLDHQHPPDAAPDDIEGQKKWAAYNEKVHSLGRSGVLSLELKTKGVTETTITKVEDLEYFEDGVRAVISIAAVMMRGLPLGN
jgi:hypothetical protein